MAPFLFNETVVIFLMAAGEGEPFFGTPDFSGVIEEGTKLQPAGSDIGSGQGMDILAYSGLSAMVAD
ncbi:MAG: hypothetical protein LBL44_10240 [Treponema sp.]|jgi:hypothetical protein|nr:hypothetical protein [Treponema sp.]